jgi:hypothetical protein
MIQLKKGELNTIIMRLDTYNYYRFEFQSIQSGEVVKCIPQNQSTITNYNKFELNVLEFSGSTSPTQSTPTIFLSYAGSWEYKIFGLTQSDLESDGKLLDTGLMNLVGPETESFFFEDELLDISVFTDFADLYQFSFNDREVYAVFEDDFSNWILRNGFWRDAGIWIDTAFWKD